MSRWLIPIVLLMQLLVAPAAVGGMPCAHTSPTSGAASSMHAQPASPHDGHATCGDTCPVASHCSTSLMAALMQAPRPHLPTALAKPTTATPELVGGYRVRPYRPPSFAMA